MMKGSRICIALIIAIAISPGAIAQSLTSTLHNGQLACLGSEVIFTCETRGSNTITWTSDTYIGTGQLGFVAATSSPGDTRPGVSNPNTLATLTREYEDQQGMIVLESTLQIIALPEPQNASVTCINVFSGERKTAYFQVIGEPAEAKDIVAVQIQHTEGNCVVHTLWRSQNSDDTQYEVRANGMLMSNDSVVVDTINGTRISALFPIRCAAYNISVRTSNICGTTRAMANYSVMQTPSHSLTELGVVSYPTNPTDDVITITDDTTVKRRTTNCKSLERAVIGLTVGLVIAIIIILVGAVAAGAYYYCKEIKPKIRDDKPKEETLAVRQSEVTKDEPDEKPKVQQ